MPVVYPVLTTDLEGRDPVPCRLGGARAGLPATLRRPAQLARAEWAGSQAEEKQASTRPCAHTAPLALLADPRITRVHAQAHPPGLCVPTHSFRFTETQPQCPTTRTPGEVDHPRLPLTTLSFSQRPGAPPGAQREPLWG